jgi:hypothetical protein
MVRVTQQFFKQQLRLFQLTRTRQTLDLPERAGRETALAPRQAVHLGVFNFITAYERIFDQVFLDRFHRGKPHGSTGLMNRIIGISSVAASRSLVLLDCTNGCSSSLREICEDVIPDLVSRVLPRGREVRKATA